MASAPASNAPPSTSDGVGASVPMPPQQAEHDARRNRRVQRPEPASLAFVAGRLAERQGSCARTSQSPSGFGTLRFRDHCCGFQSEAPSGPSENSKASNLAALPGAWTTGLVWPKDGPIRA